MERFVIESWTQSDLQNSRKRDQECAFRLWVGAGEKSCKKSKTSVHSKDCIKALKNSTGEIMQNKKE
jgi:hypothetical protein